MSTTKLPLGLTPATPVEAGFDPAHLQLAVTLLQEAVARGDIPGATLAVARHGKLVLHEAIGYAAVAPEKRAMTLDTLFDLASLTKVMATLPAILHLVERGAFRLDDKVNRFFPGFTGEGKETVSIRQLLTHTAGLAPFINLEQTPGPRAELIDRILQAPLQAKPGERIIYSDLGFILLGELVHLVSGKPLDQYVEEHIYRPMGMESVCFNPPAAWKDRCAPTEFRPYLGRHQQGEVHDERATVLGGVAGHAGLFGTAAEVAAYGTLWVNGGRAGERQILSPAMIAAASRLHAEDEGDSRGLGWIHFRSRDTLYSCGDLFSPGSIGHTGFTGTSLWIDPATGLVVAFLSNRVHLGRENHAVIRLRPLLHNIVAGALR
jgi:CubicO group peptidase (beta-lactamase class C family)